MTQIDYQLELLHTCLAAGDPAALTRWRDAFDEALEGWQLERARRLLRLVKAQTLTLQARSLVHYSEGKLLTRLGEWQDARIAYERALALKRQVGDRWGEVATLNALANLLQHGGQPLPEVFGYYQRALELAAELGDPDGQAVVLNGMGLVHYAQGQLDQAQECFVQMQTLAQAQGQRDWEAVALHNLGSIAWARGQLQEAEAYLSAALDLKRSQHDAHGQAETLNSLGLVREARGDWQAAVTIYRQSLAIMQATGDYYGRVQVLVNIGNAVWLMREYEQALAYYEQAQAIAEELGDVKLEGQALTGLGDTYRALGRYAEAEAALRRALDLKKAAGDERSLKHTYMSLGALYQNQKRLAEAEQAYEQTLRYAIAHGDTRIEAITRYNLGLVALAQEDFDLAGSRLKAAEQIALRGEYRDCLAWVYQALGDLEMMRPAPNAGRVLQCYAEACAYAGDFNQAVLDEVLDHLVKLWTAHAEDGRVEEALWFCDSMINLWQETDLAKGRSDVIGRLQDLRRRLFVSADDIMTLAETKGNDE